MNLIVDIGNSCGKYAIFSEGYLLERGNDPFGWRTRLDAYPKRGPVTRALLACTGEPPAGLREELQATFAFFREASTSLPLPISLDYETPATLGIDRVAACVAGVALYPGRDLLIVDAGTALTFNFVSAEGLFLGGNISPGAGMRCWALHEFTARLPLVGNICGPPAGAIAKNTRDAIYGGVTHGVYLEIWAYASDFRREHPAGELLLTGGDSRWLAPALSNHFNINENLVMIGLNKILEYQITNEK
ncbi:MAG: type III pantothenate kinase [Odoribacteraceae bacterium]|nr:type III pantothenate kinase [Odoribacteraceae bacterium]